MVVGGPLTGKKRSSFQDLKSKLHKCALMVDGFSFFASFSIFKGSSNKYRELANELQGFTNSPKDPSTRRVLRCAPRKKKLKKIMPENAF